MQVDLEGEVSRQPAISHGASWRQRWAMSRITPLIISVAISYLQALPLRRPRRDFRLTMAANDKSSTVALHQLAVARVETLFQQKAMNTKRTVAIAASVMLLSLTGTLLAATPANAYGPAGTGLLYQAVNPDNDGYQGIYLRDGTSMANVRRISSRYMYFNTNTYELSCGAWGEAVGPYANRRWHYIYVHNGPAAGQWGWIADRYTNTPNLANQYTPYEPECGGGNDGSVYFRSDKNEWSPATIGRDYGSWTGGNCASGNANNFASYVESANKNITTAAGWSIGRLGPVYMLEATQGNPGGGRWQDIDFILLIDPGNYEDIMENPCDTVNNRGQLFTKWLKANPNAKLVILAGGRTGEDGHRGIQELYFNYLRSSGGPRDRVLVCNYDGVSHSTMYADFMYEVTHPPALPLDAGDCPSYENWAWHP